MGEIKPMLEALLGDWPRAMIPDSSWPKPKQLERREVCLVDKPGAAQTEVRIGRIGV